MTEPVRDRYVSFCGIDCDANADKLVGMLKDRMAEPAEGERAQWHSYFTEKFEQQSKLNHDNLYFVGSQMNSLYSYFDLIEDEPAHDLLWQLEQECC